MNRSVTEKSADRWRRAAAAIANAGLALAIIAGLALLLAGCGHAPVPVAPWDRPAPPAGLTLTDLHSLGELQSTFNQDTGRPRLILLVSPT
jgi:hypothetical protein